MKDTIPAPRPITRLVLVVEAGDGASARLAAALGAGDIASVVIRAIEGRALAASAVAPLVAVIQKAGAAALIEGDAGLARTLKADGVHVAVSEAAAEAFALARETVGGGAIAGLDVGRSRHDAMTAGDDGADYVGFGIPDFVKDRTTAVARRLALVQWWAEIFEIPCIAFDVETAEEAQALGQAGADFVAMTLPAVQSPADAADLVRAMSAAVRSLAPAAT